jgi:hypothetical protein
LPADLGERLRARAGLEGRPARQCLVEDRAEPVHVRRRADRARLAADLLGRLAAADEDPELGEALDRWELSLFQGDPFGAEQRRESLVALLGGSDGIWAACLRAAVLLGERPVERGELLARLRDESPPADVVRRALVEVLMHGNRERLITTLDESLLGLRQRPAGYYATKTASPTRALAAS